MSKGVVVLLGNWHRGSCPTGVMVLRGSCPQGSCPQGSCPRDSCSRGSICFPCQDYNGKRWEKMENLVPKWEFYPIMGSLWGFQSDTRFVSSPT